MWRHFPAESNLKTFVSHQKSYEAITRHYYTIFWFNSIYDCIVNKLIKVIEIRLNITYSTGGANNVQIGNKVMKVIKYFLGIINSVVLKEENYGMGNSKELIDSTVYLTL